MCVCVCMWVWVYMHASVSICELLECLHVLSLSPTRVRRGGLACKCSMPSSVVTAGELSGDCQEEELESEKLRKSGVLMLGSWKGYFT